ncbi:MAG: LPS assembly protein LptD [Holosporales bacterium]|jgi:LPS-assembly protein|nr:LPS assembly protein LptD [Holosporales bacterium]
MRFSIKYIIAVSLLVSAGLILAHEDKTLVILSAKQVQYDDKNNIISLSGGVKLAYGEEVLEADSIIYDRRKDTVEAKGNVTLHCKDQTRFQAEYFQLTSNFKKGVAKELRGLINKKMRVSGRRMDYNSGGVTTVDKALYSVCENCKSNKNSPLVWQIRTERLEYDQKSEHMTYQNASVEFKGAPILYTPYFSHSSYKKKSCDGLLFPKFGHSSDLGIVLAPGYVWSISPSQEFLMRTILTSAAGGVLWGTYASRIMNGEIKLDSSIGSSTGAKYNRANLTSTENKEIGRLRKRGWRGHCLGYIKKDLNDKWRAFANVDWVSDKTYLAKYRMLRPNLPTLIESNVGVEFFSDRSYATAKTASYQNLSVTSVESKYIPVVLPMGHGSFVFTPELIGGNVEVTALATQMLFPHSLLERRAFVGAKWTRKWLIPGGHDIMFQAGGMADGCAVSEKFSNRYKDLKFLTNDSSAGRLYPKGALFWRWPLVASGEDTSCIFEPVVGAVVTTTLSKKYAEMINSSSLLARSFELNDVNYVSPSYCDSISDYVDNGSRIVCGLNAMTYYKSKKILRTVIGKNYNISKPQLDLHYTSGIRHRWSNLVGLGEVYPSERSRVHYRFCYAQETNEMIRQEAGTGVTVFDDTNISFDIFRGKHYAIDPVKMYYKGCRLALDTPLIGYWRGDYAIVLGEHKTLNYRIGAKYDDECFVFNIWVEHSAYVINDVKPCTNIMFSLELKSIGQIAF